MTFLLSIKEILETPGNILFVYINRFRESAYKKSFTRHAFSVPGEFSELSRECRNKILTFYVE